MYMGIGDIYSVDVSLGDTVEFRISDNNIDTYAVVFGQVMVEIDNTLQMQVMM